MAKPRIIIADTDKNYIIPLQLKFVIDYFEKIDLEIITDEEYFKEVFSSPQHVDILIVSEDLYESSLHRHNIENIFLMTEQQEGQTADLNTDSIYKYTSIKEIFNEIVGISSGVLKVKAESKKEAQIVLVTSASGGVGKTTVAMGVCASLAKNYKRVLYINASYLQSFQNRLKNSTPIASTDVYAKLTNADENIYERIKHIIRNELFSYVPPFKAALMSLGIDYSVYEKIAVSAKNSKDYDFVVVDAEVTFDENKANLLNAADKVVIVTNQTMTSVFATNALVSNINGMNSEKYIFVCNNFDENDDNALISPAVTKKFTVNDYIERFTYYEQMDNDVLGKNKSMQKTAFLVI